MADSPVLADLEVRFELAEKFTLEFRDLVRKYVPDDREPGATELLYLLQDRTSVFSPHIWAKNYKPPA